jgi:hypothetical protein
LCDGISEDAVHADSGERERDQREGDEEPEKSAAVAMVLEPEFVRCESFR